MERSSLLEHLKAWVGSVTSRKTSGRTTSGYIQLLSIQEMLAAYRISQLELADQ